MVRSLQHNKRTHIHARAGKLELVTVDFDLRTALEDAVDSVAGRAMAKGLEICCYLDPGAQTRIMGDPDRLRQIFLNLFSNGIKFTASGQVRAGVGWRGSGAREGR